MQAQEARLSLVSIEAPVKQIIADKQKLSSGGVSGDRDRRDVETRIESAERRIDEDVMKLYGVDRLPA